MTSKKTTCVKKLHEGGEVKLPNKTNKAKLVVNETSLRQKNKLHEGGEVKLPNKTKNAKLVVNETSLRQENKLHEGGEV